MPVLHLCSVRILGAYWKNANILFGYIKQGPRTSTSLRIIAQTLRDTSPIAEEFLFSWQLTIFGEPLSAVLILCSFSGPAVYIIFNLRCQNCSPYAFFKFLVHFFILNFREEVSPASNNPCVQQEVTRIEGGCSWKRAVHRQRWGRLTAHVRLDKSDLCLWEAWLPRRGKVAKCHGFMVFFCFFFFQYSTS